VPAAVSERAPLLAPAADGAVPVSDPNEIAVHDIATILARGYLRLLARKVTPVAASLAQEPSGFMPESLDDVGERSLHGPRG